MDATESLLELTISSVVPHRGRMCLLSRLLSHDPSLTSAEARIDARSIFAQSQGVPSWVGIEYIAQTVAAHDGLEARAAGNAPQIGFLISVREASFAEDFFRMGQTLRVSARHVWGDSEFFCFEGEIIDEQTGAVLVRAQLNFYRPKDQEIFVSRKKMP